MVADEWAGLPELGTLVRVPYPKAPAIGEVVAHYRLFGEPRAQVRVELPVSHEPYETHTVTMAYRPDLMEIIPS
jgi:hypothetical protein